MSLSINLSLVDKASRILMRLLPWIIFILGLWLVVLRPMGSHWEFIPGDLGDSRFNNYILEHFFRWISGADTSFWNAPFFYPYQNVTAMSDNLLGSAFFYAILRWAGLDRETAFQGWFVLSFFVNYLAVVYVLSRFKFHPLAISVGAFFFSFGMPLLSQESHLQLFYRFGIPLACYFLVCFFENPRFTNFTALIFWTVWQFYLSIYLGFFLILLLTTLAILIPVFGTNNTNKGGFSEWPKKFIQAWKISTYKERALYLSLACLACLGLLALLSPYYNITKEFGFIRDWKEVSSMLPLPQSLLLADSSWLWGTLSKNLSDIPMRWEHQIFPGLAITILTATGLLTRIGSNHKRVALLYFWSGFFLIILVLNLNGYSLYWLIWNFPGVNSIRAVTRIELVLMWPQAFFAAWAVDSLINQEQKKLVWQYGFLILLTILLLAESIFFVKPYFSKAEALSLLDHLKQSIPTILPKNPILSFAYNQNELDFISELDAMLLAQDLGWPTLNGYSGNSPQGYNLPISCFQIPDQIKKYFKAVNMNKEERLSFYLDTMKRIVPIGYSDCNPEWWKKMP